MKSIKLIVLLIGVSVALLAALIKMPRLVPRPARTSQAAKVQPEIQLLPLTTIYEYGKHDFRDISILTGGKVWSVGYDGQDPKRFFYSGDWGHTWETRPVQSSGFTLKSITFVDEQHGWAVGGYGTILRTTNGGDSWEQVKRPTAAELQEVRFFTANIGYAAGSSR